MNIAKSLARDRSHDPRLQVCAIIVPEDNTGILALGYNGMQRGGPNVVASLEPGKSETLHAELNCIIKAPFHYPLKKHMYLTHSPCVACSKIIVNANISRVVYDVLYRDDAGLDVLRSARVDVLQLGDAISL